MYKYRLSRVGEMLLVDGFDNRVTLCLHVIAPLTVLRDTRLEILEGVIKLQAENERLKKVLDDIGIQVVLLMPDKPSRKILLDFIDQAPKKGGAKDGAKVQET